MRKPRKEQMIDFYRQMLRIRRTEEKLMEVFPAGEIPGFLHVSIGQEAAPVGVCAHLRDDDYIGTTHRGHGYAIAKGIGLKRAMAELFGRKEGYCMGRSGSMHLADLSKGIMGANSIVGGGSRSWPVQALPPSTRGRTRWPWPPSATAPPTRAPFTVRDPADPAQRCR